MHSLDEHAGPKIACACCDRIVQAPAASSPIERGLAGSGFLACALVAKYADRVPTVPPKRDLPMGGRRGERSLLASGVAAVSALLRSFIARQVGAPAACHARRALSQVGYGDGTLYALKLRPGLTRYADASSIGTDD